MLNFIEEHYIKNRTVMTETVAIFKIEMKDISMYKTEKVNVYYTPIKYLEVLMCMKW